MGTESESSHLQSPHLFASITAGAREEHWPTDLSARCSLGAENTG